MSRQKYGDSMCESRKQRWTIRKLSIGVVSVLLGMTMMISYSPVIHAYENSETLAEVARGVNITDRGMDTTTHFTASGIEDSSLRYASTVYNKIDNSGNIFLRMSKWADGSTGWGEDKNNEFAGKYLLSFTNDSFYKEIDRITIDNKSMAKRDDGALWTISITNIPNYALIGVVTNHDVKITLKNGQTLQSMGLANTAISFSSVWIKNNGSIARESISNGYILENNPNVKNEKQTGFTAGQMTQKVLFDADNMSIKSIHTFKPNENYLQSDYGWVVYVKEQIPAVLLKYIDTDNITINNSDVFGDNYLNRKVFKISIDDTGLVDTSTVSELSIVGNDTKVQLNEARKNTNEIFWGTLGQSRDYTITYKLKDNVSIADFARAMNDYIQEKNARILFDHWLEADYLNDSDQKLIHKPDGGAAPKQLVNSYSNAYLDTNDTDKDGLFDFVEWNIGSDTTKVDTDGDGVPDGQEFMTDKTNLIDAADYLVSKPLTNIMNYDPTKNATITGTVPKPLIIDPANADKLISITNPAAGNVIVKLQGYDETNQTYTNDEYATTKIPFDNLITGSFTLNVNANVVPNGKKAVLVAYSPNGKNAVMGDPMLFSITDAEKYDAKGKDITVDMNGTPEAEDGIKNKNELPNGTSYEWKTPVDTSTPGEKTGTIVVTYPDKSTEEVEVKVNVVDRRTDAEKYDPITTPEILKPGEKPNLSDNVSNLDDLPNGTQIKDITPEGNVNLNKPGEYTGLLEITYPDGSKENVEVKIIVEKVTADTNRPKTGDMSNSSLQIFGMFCSSVTLLGLFMRRHKKGKYNIK